MVDSMALSDVFFSAVWEADIENEVLIKEIVKRAALYEKDLLLEYIVTCLYLEK